MASFSDRPWSDRFQHMGDVSEKHFVEHVEGRCVRFGLDRPQGVHVPKLPERIRATPDFLCDTGFVECLGVGRKQVLQIKLTKYMALHWWNDVWPVSVWVWDSHRQRGTLVTLRELDRLIQQPDVIGLDYFDDRKLVLTIDVDLVFGVET